MDALAQTVAVTWSARSVVPSVTLPAHLSMWRGVTPAKHGVPDNVYFPSASAYPSAFEIAHRAGLRTAMFYSWEELRDLAAPGHLTMSWCHEAKSNDGTDQRVAEAAAQYITMDRPDLVFVYFGDTDLIGHDHGWMSAPYLAAIERSDRALGSLLDTLTQAGVRDQYTVLFLSDHGGHERAHGSDSAADVTIPWVLNGPGVRQGYAIQGPVHIIDTAATIAHLLNLPRPAEWEGQPITEALDA
ncbi:MAG: hypothetical protein EHM39_05410 [Chloroflexi bacterium]|nr:MAG: hypothetical protein EHM39_05410 [Chloroflexota bacterium]